MDNNSFLYYENMKICLKYNVLNKIECDLLKKYITEMLNNNEFKINYPFDNILTYDFNFEKKSLLDEHINKILKTIKKPICHMFNCSNFQMDNMKINLKLFKSREDGEYDFDSYYEDSVTIMYNLKLLNKNNSSKSLVCENENFNNFLIDFISETINNIIKAYTESLLSIKLQEVEEIKNYNVCETKYDINSYFEKLFITCDINEELFCKNKDKILLSFKYCENFFEKLLFNIINDYKHILIKNTSFLDLLPSIKEEAKKINIELNQEEEENFNGIFNAYLDHFKITFINFIDSQGHIKILVPENPFPSCFIHVDNSFIIYPGYYLKKKKSVHCYLDDIEGYILINFNMINKKK